MSKPKYSWLDAYLYAVLETNPELKFDQVCEAVAAIEKGRLSPVESDEERRELANAEEGLKALMAESMNLV